MLREICTNVRFVSDARKRLCTWIKTSYSVSHSFAMHNSHATSIIFAVSSLCAIHFLCAWNTQMTNLSICVYVQYTKDHTVSHNAMDLIWTYISSVTKYGKYETLEINIFVTSVSKQIKTKTFLLKLTMQATDKTLHRDQSNLIHLQMTLLSWYFSVNQKQMAQLRV